MGDMADYFSDQDELRAEEPQPEVVDPYEETPDANKDTHGNEVHVIPTPKSEPDELGRLIIEALSHVEGAYWHDITPARQHIRALVTEQSRKAYMRGKIDEAKICAEAQRHDSRKARNDGWEDYKKKLGKDSPAYIADMAKASRKAIEEFAAELKKAAVYNAVSVERIDQALERRKQ